VDAISTMAPELWEIAVRQVIVEQITMMVVFVLISIAAAMVARWMFKSEEYDFEGVPWIFAVLSFFFIMVLTCIPAIMVPEWQAIQNLMDLMT
jgi:uncharacterized membrane protein